MHILRIDEAAVSSLGFALKARLRAEQKQGLGPARMGLAQAPLRPRDLGTAAL